MIRNWIVRVAALVAALLLTSMAAPAFAAFALVANRSDSLGDHGGTSGSFNSTGGTLIVVAVASSAHLAAGASDISDSKGNSDWRECSSSSLSLGPRVQIFSHASPTVGSGHTITVRKANIQAAIAIAVFSGGGVSPCNTTSTAGNNPKTARAEGAAALAPSASLTPSSDNALVITAVAFSTSATITEPSGFTLTNTQAVGSGTPNGVSLAYQIQTTATARTPSWTSSVSNMIVTITSAFLLS